MSEILPRPLRGDTGTIDDLSSAPGGSAAVANDFNKKQSTWGGAVNLAGGPDSQNCARQSWLKSPPQPPFPHNSAISPEQANHITHSLSAQAAAVTRVPEEIVTDILHLTPDSLPEPDTYQGHEYSVTAPWTIGQVCQSWRRIALASPHLWSHLFFESRSADSGPGALELLKLQLLRSSSLPLNVFIYLAPEAHDDSPAQDLAIDMVFQALLDTSHRWVEAKVGICDGFRISSSIQPRTYPSLQRLTLSRYEAAITFFSGPKSLPQLVEIRSCDFQFYPPTSGAFQNIRSLDLLPWGPLDLEAAPSDMPNLERLVVRDYRTVGRGGYTHESYVASEKAFRRTQGAQIVFPKVRHLHLALRAKNSAPAYKHLLLPSLVSLHLSGTTFLHSRQPMAEFVSQSSERLTSLTLAVQWSGEHGSRIRDLLQRCYNVSHLVLYAPFIQDWPNAKTEEMCRILTWDVGQHSQQQCPQLSSLELEFPVLPEPALSAMVESRLSVSLNPGGGEPPLGLHAFCARVLNTQSLQHMRTIPHLAVRLEELCNVRHGVYKF